VDFKQKNRLKYWLILTAFLTFLVNAKVYSQAQERAVFEDPGTLMWLGTYSTIRIGEKLYYEAQHHFRTSNFEGTPWVGRVAQIYNRHAITYKVSNNFLFTVGPVLRLNFSPDPGNPEFENLTLEPRIWHEYSFPFSTFLGNRQIVVQHRLRFEHRWNRSNAVGSDYIYRDRYRYRFTVKFPIGTKKFKPKSWYASPMNWEIIMQSGREVVDAPMEDMRVYPSIGYISSSKIAYSFGMMYTLGQRRAMGFQYRQRWVARINVWWTPDFRKFQNKIPEINIFD
jgi:hypothetical protein